MARLTTRMVDTVKSGSRIIGLAYTVRVRGDHGIVFVSAPDPRSDGRPQRALGAFRIDLTSEEMLGLPGPNLVRLVAYRMAAAAADWEQSMTAAGPRAPGGATGAAVIPGQGTLDF